MLNSVGLQGPGVEAWLADELPGPQGRGRPNVVASIWGRRVEDYAAAASLLAERAGLRRRRRGERQLPEPRGPKPHVRPLALGDGRGRGGLGGLRAAALGQALAEHLRARLGRTSRARERGPRP